MKNNRLSLEDQLEIHEKIALYGHLLDEQDYLNLGEVFTDDSTFDLTGYGGVCYKGLSAIIELMQTSTEHPAAHHASNVVIENLGEGAARVKSKGLGVGHKGRVGSVTYIDLFVFTAAGWRISRRSVWLQGR